MKSITTFVIAFLFTLAVNAQECRKYTDEQKQVLWAAYNYGEPYNYSLTLAAISVKESFLGNKILRVNPNDPSFGVTHIQFDTIKHLSGENHWGSIEIAEKLVADDLLSFEYSVKKLDSVSGTFWTRWRKYNGSGPAAEAYANEVQAIIRGFKRCGVFDYWG